MPTTLVTGGAGFIGSHLCDALVERGDQVVVLDDLSGGRESNLTEAIDRGAIFERADVTDAAAVAAIFKRHAPERVFHLAAQVDVRKATADPVHDATANVLGTINVLEAMRLAGTGAPIVFASTGGAIYGEGEGLDLPLDESADCRPETPYGTSKLSGEEYLALYRRAHGIPALALRFGNVYGPRQDPHGEAGVVAIFCGLLIEGRPPKVFGDGRQTRDYVYVADVVAAMLGAEALLLERGTDEEGPFNVGTGREATVIDLIDGLAPHSDRPFEPDFAPPRPGEVQRIALDAGRAAQALGWSPQMPLGDGLERTLASVRAERADAAA